MNDEKTEITAGQVAKPEQQPVETKPDTKPAKTPTKDKKTVKKASKAKPTKKAIKKAKVAKSKGKTKANKTKAKLVKTAKKTKNAKAVPSKFPRHKSNPFREGSSYGAIFDAFVLKKNGIRRDELSKLAMEATGKDAKHASYDLAVILSAKDSNTGQRHKSSREGYWVRRENDHLILMID